MHHIKQFLQGVFCVIIFFGGVTPSYGENENNVIRLFQHPQKTRIVLETERLKSYKSFSLSNPQRFVLNVKNMRSLPSLENLETVTSVNDPVLKNIRVGQFEKNVVRIVFDLRKMVDPQIFALEPYENKKHRIVVDLPHDKQRGSDQVAGNEQIKNNEKTGISNKIKKDVPLIAIDAGHGGEDPGAIGTRGTKEKIITLAIAKKLKKLLDKEKKINGFLVRKGDYYISLRKRYKIAEKKKADLLISIHADAFMKQRARGSSVYILSQGGASSAQARWLASKENQADLIGGVNLKEYANKGADVKYALTDMALTGKRMLSHRCAEDILEKISKINKLHKKNVEKAGFMVLKSPTLPSVLIETAFLTNPAEEKKLRQNSYQWKMAKAILAGIKQYLKDPANSL